MKKEAIVRADSEKEARMLASVAFQVATETQASGKAVDAPWRSPDFVDCSALMGSSFQEEGVGRVLNPVIF